MSERVEQVNQLIKTEAGAYLQEHLTAHMGVLTITAVHVTADLRLATIWYGYVGDDLDMATRELKKVSRDLQKYINKRFTMKNVPKILFKYDNSGDYAVEISKVIDDANRNHTAS